MSATNYPYGVTAFGTATAAGVTSITGVGTVATGLTTVAGGVVSLAALPGTAGGSAAFAIGTAEGANLIIRTYQYNGVTAGTVAQNVAWTAFGSLS